MKLCIIQNEKKSDLWIYFNFYPLNFQYHDFLALALLNKRSNGSESTETKCKQNQLFGARSSIQNNCGFSICWNG